MHLFTALFLFLEVFFTACVPRKPLPGRFYPTRFEVPQTGFAALEVRDTGGRFLKTEFQDRALKKGLFVFSWDGRDGKGKTLPPGEYVLRLHLDVWRVEAAGAFGGMGSAPGRFLSPRGIAAHPQGGRLLVAVADTGNNRAQLLTDTGSVLQVMGHFGSSEARLSHPADVAWDGQIVTVVDSGNRRLAFFDARGTFTGEVRRLKGLAVGTTEFTRLDFQNPVRVVQDGPGTFWVLDRGFSRVVHLTSEGRLLRSLEGISVTGDDFCLRPQGDLWIALDYGQVRWIARGENRRTKIKLEGNPETLGGLAAVRGFVIGTDTKTKRVLLWDASGRLGGVFHLSEMNAPGVLAAWSDETGVRVFVVDRSTYRIQPYLLKKDSRILEVRLQVAPTGVERAGR